MTNCQAEGLHAPPSNDVAPSATLNRFECTLPDRSRWPNTRRALVQWTQEHLDRELSKMPRGAWFERALTAHLRREARR